MGVGGWSDTREARREVKYPTSSLRHYPPPPSHPTPLPCVSSPARGSAIAKIVGSNAGRLAHFDPRVTMWVFEEDIGGRKLTEIINTQHENVKYLPGHKLPPNVVSSNLL